MAMLLVLCESLMLAEVNSVVVRSHVPPPVGRRPTSRRPSVR